MSGSLRDQLMGLGFKPAPRPDARPRPGQGAGKGPAAKRGADRHAGKGSGKGGRKPAAGRGRQPGDEIDLAKAYAIRAQKEKDERLQAERERQEQARKRREALARLEKLLVGKALNSDEADIARHFEYGGKIKRVYVTAEQLSALNAGELGVLQQRGRYLLVTAEVLAEAEQVFPAAVALKVDPDTPASDDPYADPKYQVPDDLVW